MKQTQRLDKILAHVGIGSRSELKRLAKEGAIYVNGAKVKDSGMQVYPDKDIIQVNGETVRYREFVYLMMNKPQGVVSATEDNRDRTVVDLLDEAYAPFEVFPVGRLDKDTEGFLCLPIMVNLRITCFLLVSMSPKLILLGWSGRLPRRILRHFRKE